jgi:site-specific recombinase XerC
MNKSFLLMNAAIVHATALQRNPLTPGWPHERNHRSNERTGGRRDSVPIAPTGPGVYPASKAESTIRGYRADWRDFCGWCEARGLNPLPASPETVASYIADCAGRLKVGTVQRRINAIAEAHKAVGLESPTHHAMVTNTMKGIRRMLGTASVQKAPAVTDDIRAMVDATDMALIGARDRALVLLGFAGAFRRSELVELDVEDCTFGKDGLTVTLRRSKTDQERQGRKIGTFGRPQVLCQRGTV